MQMNSPARKVLGDRSTVQTQLVFGHVLHYFRAEWHWKIMSATS